MLPFVKLIAIAKLLIEWKLTPTKKLPKKYNEPRATKPCYAVTYT